MAEQHDLVIRNARIVTPERVIEGDLAVQGAIIASIGTVTGPSRRQIDAKGAWLMPGGVDPHAHIEQMSGMGLMNADTFESATRSAAMGGTTSVLSFAAQKKGEPLAETVAAYAARARRGAMIDHAFHIIVTDPAVTGFKADLAALAGQGHRSIKLFTTYAIKLDDTQILGVMAAAGALGMVVCVHAENDAIITHARDALIAAGRTEPHAHAASHPRLSEIEALERLCRFAEYTGAKVMLFHVSTAEGAEVVRIARARGAPVRAETCPHYLLMTEDVLDQPEGGKWMCSPPQRDAADQAALWRALLAGDIDIVSSDHAPYRYDQTGKLAAGPNPPFHAIANGMPGLEVRLPLMFDALVTNGPRDPLAFARLTASAPADLHGLPRKGRITPGFDADLVVWNADRRVTYGENDLHDNTGYNPWAGFSVTGWPETVILRGQVLVEGGALHAQPGAGQWLARPSPIWD